MRTMMKRLGSAALWALALATFGATTGCPEDPICLDCLLTVSAPCGGKVTFTATVPSKASAYTSPKLLVTWSDKGAPVTSTVNIGTPRSTEPWKPGMAINVALTGSDFPENMCNIPTNGAAPYGAWSKATVQVTSTTDTGATSTWPVKMKLN